VTLRKQCQQIGLNLSDDARSITNCHVGGCSLERSISLCGPARRCVRRTIIQHVIVGSSADLPLRDIHASFHSFLPRHFRFLSVGVQCGRLDSDIAAEVTYTGRHMMVFSGQLRPFSTQFCSFCCL